MKSSILLITLLCISLQSYAQNAWSLFPTGQRSFWDTGTEMKMFYCDSVEVSSTHNTNLFGAKYYTVGADSPCFDTVLLLYSGSTNLPIQTCKSEQGIWTFSLSNNQSIAFNTLASVGQTWDVPITGQGFNALRFTCYFTDTIVGRYLSHFGNKSGAGVYF